GELLVLVQLVFMETDVLIAFDSDGGKPETVGISPVLLDHVERIDGIAFRLRHSFSVFGLDNRVDENVLERNGADELDAGEDHARYPQVDDLACRRQDGSRIEGFQKRR